MRIPSAGLTCSSRTKPECMCILAAVIVYFVVVNYRQLCKTSFISDGGICSMLLSVP